MSSPCQQPLSSLLGLSPCAYLCTRSESFVQGWFLKASGLVMLVLRSVCVCVFFEVAMLWLQTVAGQCYV